ncbi:hypothetical protein BU17DRAFT_80211 [Hysterangium stoloniferum]|nr:hypothetical protein BU17DRAFT_80211 [Hysterangium stoloniferum]
MPRLTGRALALDMANTIIEDSEPEREAEAAKLKGNKKRRKKEPKAQSDEEDDGSIPRHDTVVLTERENNFSTATSLPSICVVPEVIEISDNTISITEDMNLRPIQVLASAPCSSPSSEDEIQEIRMKSPKPVVNDMDLIVPPIDLEACTSVSLEQEIVVSKLDLARFVFEAKARPNVPAPATSPFFRPVVRQENPPPPKALKPSKGVVHLPSFAVSYSHDQLGGLLKCFVCDLAWTARKTVPTKMAHIKACARKHGWGDSTVAFKLETAIGHLPAINPATAQGLNNKAKVPATSNTVRTTLLDDVLHEADPKKKRKKGRSDIVAILDPQEAHAAIVERARALFAQPDKSLSRPSQRSPSTQCFGLSKLGGPSRDPGDPALGVLVSAPVNGSSVNILEDVDRNVLPFSTQTFGASGVAQRFVRHSRPLMSGMDITTSNPSETISTSARLPEPLTPPHNILNISPSRPYADADSMSSNSESDALHFCHTMSRKKLFNINRLSPIPKEQPRGRLQHYVQHSSCDNNIALENLANQTRKCNSTGISKGRQKSHGVKSKSASRSKSKSPKSHKSSRSRSLRRTFSDTETHTDKYYNPAMHNDLRCIIKSDESLYERILRYEPIHFDTFLNIPAIKEMDIQHIRPKLKYFLDSHAIHFYGYLDLAGNRRRY